MTNSTPFSTGPSAPLQDEHDALPAGTRLGEFEMLRVLGVGGFGIVYLAMDHALDRLVAVKEYMPSMMAARGKGTQVSLRSSMHQDTFNIGLRSFVNEAKLLARFNHPSLVKVYRFWEANGTAYMAMPFYPGRTLKDERRAMLTIPDESWLRAVVDPLLGAMEVLHKEDVYHRDIAPDNILLLPDGPPVLLDFGAARSVIGDRTQSLTAVLKPSYAPIEQYADVGHLRQGAWTDLYALGAVLHFVVTGRPPIPSASRAVHDNQPSLTTLNADQVGNMPLKVLKAIDWALTVSPHTRPQNVKQFRDALDGLFEPPQRTQIDVAGLSREPSRAAPSGWSQTLEVPESAVPLPEAAKPPAASDTDIEFDFTAGPAPVADGGDAAATLIDTSLPTARTSVTVPPVAVPVAAPVSAPVPAPSPAPVPPPPPVPAAPAPVTAPAQATAPAAPVVQPPGPAPAPASPRRSSRALPPLFEGEPPAESGSGLRTGLFVAALLALLLVVLGGGYWVLKDRGFLGSSSQPLPPVAPPPVASAPTVAPPASVPMVRLEQPTPPPVTDTPPVAPPEPSPKVVVPDWSASAVQPKPPVAAASAQMPAASAVTPPAVTTPVAPTGRKPATSPPPVRVKPKGADEAKPAAPTPRETCNARASGSMQACMRRVCGSGPLVDHAQCVQFRRDDEW